MKLSLIKICTIQVLCKIQSNTTSLSPVHVRWVGGLLASAPPATALKPSGRWSSMCAESVQDPNHKYTSTLACTEKPVARLPGGCRHSRKHARVIVFGWDCLTLRVNSLPWGRAWLSFHSGLLEPPDYCRRQHLWPEAESTRRACCCSTTTRRCLAPCVEAACHRYVMKTPGHCFHLWKHAFCTSSTRKRSFCVSLVASWSASFTPPEFLFLSTRDWASPIILSCNMHISEAKTSVSSVHLSVSVSFVFFLRNCCGSGY